VTTESASSISIAGDPKGSTEFARPVKPAPARNSQCPRGFVDVPCQPLDARSSRSTRLICIGFVYAGLVVAGLVVAGAVVPGSPVAAALVPP